MSSVPLSVYEVLKFDKEFKEKADMHIKGFRGLKKLSSVLVLKVFVLVQSLVFILYEIHKSYCKYMYIIKYKFFMPVLQR